MRRHLLPVVLALGTMLLTTACDAGSTIDERPCPPEGTELSYDNFGADFIGTYCQRCHGKPTSDREGAPSGYDFGSVDDVRRFKDRIFARAAEANTTMPPGPDDPPADEREKLAEWLACGAP